MNTNAKVYTKTFVNRPDLKLSSDLREYLDNFYEGEDMSRQDIKDTLITLRDQVKDNKAYLTKPNNQYAKDDQEQQIHLEKLQAELVTLAKFIAEKKVDLIKVGK